MIPNPTENYTPLLPERAFVVQLVAAENPDEDPMAGRVEHIGSGRAAMFSSMAELSQIMTKLLR